MRSSLWAALVMLAMAVVGVGVVLVVGGDSSRSSAQSRQDVQHVGDLALPARVRGRTIEAATKDGFAPMFWPGVNLGPTTPGHQPGEVAATRQEYGRWLDGMGDLGVRVVRIYTILRPSFYNALDAYNETHTDRPIMLIQGVWIPEHEFNATGNAYDKSVTDAFKAELSDAMDVVHGDADLPVRSGHADGRYRSDVARWLLAFSIGVEWDPYSVQSTDEKNAGKAPYEGRYIRATTNATPMESWVASMLDDLAGLDAQRGWSRPLTFTNWLTLDPLKHPEEPLEQEDLVSLDAYHVRATDAWPGGFFASYHAYPYYPEFMRLAKDYANYHRARDGKVDPYAGYLHALRVHHHDQAVAITEFGVPSSLGVAHLGPLGRDQGDHSEQEALRMDGDMLRDIKDEGYASGILFAWMDEWFKHTWNTVDYELPADRRQLWRNDLTNEEHFGVIATEPGKAPVVELDGKDSEWADNGSRVIGESQHGVREVRATSDAEFVYLRLLLDHDESWRTAQITVGIDVRKGDNRGLPGHPGVFPQADVALKIGHDDAELLQAAWWEPTRIRYGLGREYIKVDPKDMKPDSGAWVHPLQILNRPVHVPSSGEDRPAEFHDLGHLKIGDGVPGDHGFDQRTLVAAQGKVVEVRLPWALLGFSDPSSHKLYVEHPKDATTTTDALPLRAVVLQRDDPPLKTTEYPWDPWDAVVWHERRKTGFDDLARVMRELP